MLALYRSGRQADALQAYRDARRELLDELGLEPGRALAELEQSILVHDSALDPPGRPTARGSPATAKRRLRGGVLIAAAARLSGPQRDLAYGALDLDIARNGAPLAAFGNPSSNDFFSARIGCQTYGVYGMDLAALCIRRPHP
jgi:hypothetical protein